MCMKCATNLRYLIEKHNGVEQRDYDDFRADIRQHLSGLAAEIHDNTIDVYGVLEAFFKVYEICAYLWNRSSRPSERGFLAGEISTATDIDQYMQQAATYSSSKMSLEDAQIALLSIYKVCCSLELDSVIAMQTWSRFSKYDITSIAVAKPGLF